MIDIIAWVAAYAGLVTLAMTLGHRAEVGEHRARDRQSDRLGRKVESVAVHATYVTAKEASVRDE